MENDENLNAIAGGSILTLLGMVIALALEFAMRVVAARFLTVPEFGSLFLGFKILNIALFLGIFGMDNGSTAIISAELAKQNTREIRMILGSTVSLTFLFGCISSVTLLLAADSIAAYLNVPKLSPVLQILAIGLIPILVIRVISALFRGMKIFKPKTYFEDSAFYILRLAAVLFVVYILATAETFALAISLSAVVTALAYLSFFKRKNPFGVGVSSGSAKSLLMFSLPLAVQMLSYQLMTATDIISLAMFSTASIVGVYGSVVILSQFTAIGTQAVYFALLPSASDSYSRGEIDALQRNYVTASRWGLMISLFIFVVLESFPRSFLAIFGADYVVGVLWLEILAGGYLIHSVIGLSGPTLVAIGKPHLNGLAWIVSAITTMAIAIMVVPSMGAIGATLSIGAGFLLVNLIHIFFLRREISLKPLGPGSVKSLIIAAFVIILVRLMIPEPGGGFSILFLTAYAFIPLALFGVLALLLGAFAKDDILFLEIVESVMGTELTPIRRLILRFGSSRSEGSDSQNGPT